MPLNSSTPTPAPRTVAGLPRRLPLPFRPGFGFQAAQIPLIATEYGPLPAWNPAPMANVASVPSGVGNFQPSELLRAAANGSPLELTAGAQPIAALPPGPQPALPRWNPMPANVASIPEGAGGAFTPTNSLRGALNRSIYNPSQLVELQPGAFTPAPPPMPSESIIGRQMGSAIGANALPGTGVFGTGVMANSRFAKPMTGIKGLAGGAVAGLVGGGLRDRILYSGTVPGLEGRVINTDTAGGRIADAATNGMVLGVPGGPASMGVAGAGLGLGQAGVELLASDYGQWVPSPLGALHSTLAERDAEGRSVNTAIGRLMGQHSESENLIPDAVRSVMETADKTTNDLIAAENKRIEETVNATNLTDIGRQMGLSPAANSELAASWDESVRQLSVLMERGLLTAPAPDPNDPNKTVDVKITKENFPQYLEMHFNQMVQSIPEIVATEREQQAAEAARIQEQNARLNRAVSYGAAIRDIMGSSGQMAALQNNPYTAGIAPLIMQGAVGQPMVALNQLAAEEAAASQAELIKQQNAALAQQQAYELALARAQAEAQAKAATNGTADPTATP